MRRSLANAAHVLQTVFRPEFGASHRHLSTPIVASEVFARESRLGRQPHLSQKSVRLGIGGAGAPAYFFDTCRSASLAHQVQSQQVQRGFGGAAFGDRRVADEDVFSDIKNVAAGQGDVGRGNS